MVGTGVLSQAQDYSTAYGFVLGHFIDEAFLSARRVDERMVHHFKKCVR